jgi:hypothetical protein
MPTPYLFGMGERNSPSLRLKKGEYTLYGRDDPILVETGTRGNNVYGSHPMYLMKEKSGNFHVVFFKNSAAMDVQVADRAFTIRAVRLPISYKNCLRFFRLVA